MEKRSQLMHVTVNGKTCAYPYGTPYGEIAMDFQAEHEDDILLVDRQRKLCELNKTLDRDCSLTMVTARDKPGMQTYERSLVFLMLAAFHDVVGAGKIRRISVEHSISRALFVTAKGDFTLDRALLDKVEAKMRELVARALPIRKASIQTDDAIELFRSAGMPDKASLLRFRINSRVNIYSLENFRDYFYGYMVPNTRYLKVFALELFSHGFVLRLPSQADPKKLAPFTPSRKVSEELYDATVKSGQLGICNVGELNEAISAGRSTDIILAHEAMMEKRIGDIAQEIARRPGVRFVMIAGPSSSGKTTFSHRLATQLRACGMRPHPIATDNYFVDRENTPLDENGQYNFESLKSMDAEQFNKDMRRLLSGETVELPRFNFKKVKREYAGDLMTLGGADVLIVEGIHCLNDAFTYSLPRESKYKIYISCLTTLNIDDHNRIPTTDARLLRRIQRDARTRGISAQATIQMWPSVRRGEEENIFPFQDSADTIFNSALIYETALLKPYIEPLLFNVPRDSDAYIEAKRLLKFLNYFLPLPADDVPKTSLIREFIGGGCYQA